MTFNVSGNTLNAILNQRSQDMLAANSWNISQYSLLQNMLSKIAGLEVGELVHVIADAQYGDYKKCSIYIMVFMYTSENESKERWAA